MFTKANTEGILTLGTAHSRNRHESSISTCHPFKPGRRQIFPLHHLRLAGQSLKCSYTRNDRPLGIRWQHQVLDSHVFSEHKHNCGSGFQIPADFFPSPAFQSSAYCLLIIVLIDFVVVVYIGQSSSVLYNQGPSLIQKVKKFLTMLTKELLVSVSDCPLKSNFKNCFTGSGICFHT